MCVNPEIPENTRHTRKYPKNPEIPESKKDTRKYPIVYFDTPTQPEPDPLPGILSSTRPDPILKNPTRWALIISSTTSRTRLLNHGNVRQDHSGSVTENRKGAPVTENHK